MRIRSVGSLLFWTKWWRTLFGVIFTLFEVGGEYGVGALAAFV